MTQQSTPAQMVELAEMYAAQIESDFTAQIDRIINGLLRQVDELGRIRDRSGKDVFATAEMVQHTVLWGLANLGVDRLTMHAKNVQMARERVVLEQQRAEQAAAKRASYVVVEIDDLWHAVDVNTGALSLSYPDRASLESHIDHDQVQWP